MEWIAITVQLEKFLDLFRNYSLVSALFPKRKGVQSCVSFHFN